MIWVEVEWICNWVNVQEIQKKRKHLVGADSFRRTPRKQEEHI